MLKKQKFALKLLQREGFSLQEILITTSLLGGLFLLSISVFNLNSKISKKAHNSERCVVLAKTISSRFQDGANSTFINSVGFNATGAFQTGIYNSAWNSDRFKVASTLIDAIPHRPTDPKMNNAAVNPDPSSPLMIDESQGLNVSFEATDDCSGDFVASGSPLVGVV